MDFFTIIVSLVLFAFFFPVIVGPFVVRFQHYLKRNAALESVDFAELPPEAQNHFTLCEREFNGLGFAQVGLFYQQNLAPNVKSYYSLWRNDQRGDSAVIGYFAAQNGITSLNKKLFAFATEYADGTKVETNNTGEPSTFWFPPHFTVHRLPNNQNPFLLYQVHCQQLAKMSKNVEKVLPPSDGETDDFVASVEDLLSFQVDKGLYFLDEKSNKFRPTLAGAFLMTWTSVFPFRQVVDIRMKNQGETLLKELSGAKNL